MKLRRYGGSMTAPPMGAKKGSVRLYMERTGEWDEMLTFTRAVSEPGESRPIPESAIL
jgi:hypothetical protein